MISKLIIVHIMAFVMSRNSEIRFEIKFPILFKMVL